MVLVPQSYTSHYALNADNITDKISIWFRVDTDFDVSELSDLVVLNRFKTFKTSVNTVIVTLPLLNWLKSLPHAFLNTKCPCIDDAKQI